MKKFLLVLGLALLVLIAVLTVRTATVKSRQVQAAPVKDLAIDSRAAAERLAGAIRFPTISHEDGRNVEAEAFRGLHQYLQQTFPRVHAALTREVVADHSLLYTWKGKDPALAPILLMSHQDVVPVEPGTEKDWTHPAFSGAIDGGYVWGRGTLDDKVGVLAILEAAETLLARGFQPQRTVYFAFGHDEEVGGTHGAAAIGALLERRGIRPELILDEGGIIAEGMVPGVAKPVALIGTAEKGYLSVELVAEASGGHSSMPPPHSAIGKLAAAVEKLENHPMPARIAGATKSSFEYLAPEMPFGPRLVLANLWLFGPLAEKQFAADPAGNARIRTSTAATVFQAGVKENVLPHRARAVVNFRILPGDSIADVLRHVREAVGPDIRVRATGVAEAEPSPESATGAPAFGLLQRTVAQTFPGSVVAPNLLSGGTDTKHYQRLSHNVYRFLPIRIQAEDLARLHGTNERVGVESYGEAIRFYAQLLRNGAG
ncbi:MAG TPA: M20 family peptidase [Thermoanaerobaculia bacterium]|nr:M20 family peptidase [Thermoanaerobaculia bacterium]